MTYNEHNSLTSRHKIAIDGMTYRYNPSVNLFHFDYSHLYLYHQRMECTQHFREASSMYKCVCLSSISSL